MRKEIPREQCRPDPKFNLAPTGHITRFRSPDDPGMEFSVPDCGVKAGGQFEDPFFLDERDLPCEEDEEKGGGF